ncbi:sugar ABC transporter substrate-binding protein [Diaminobutyricimonas aerilata]|nr:maltose ABC transporter substrate-binding protein [Diaminobutyricimonas aerilata]
MTVKTPRRSLLLAGAALAGGALVLSGCSASDGGGGESDTSTLTVWLDANRAEALGDVISDFEEENDVTVDVVQKDFPAIAGDFTQQAPTGKGPDVVIAPHDALGQLVTNGIVEPITLENPDDFQEVAIQAVSYEGQVYGVPVSIENVALIRNTDLDPNAHATFDELVSAGQALVGQNGVEYPVIIQAGDNNLGDPYHLYPIQTSFGAPVFGTDAEGAYNPEDLQMDNEGGKAFAAKLAEWGASGVLNPSLTGDIAIESFVGGKSPYMITGPWNLERIKEAGFGYSIEAIPSAGGQPSQPFVGVQGFFVSSYSENALLANKFVVDYMGSEEVQTAIFESGGRAPALKTAFEAAQSDPDAAAFGEVGANGAPQPSIPAMSVVWEDWGVTEGAIIDGSAGDPAAAWAAMAEGIRGKIAAG